MSMFTTVIIVVSAILFFLIGGLAGYRFGKTKIANPALLKEAKDTRNKVESAYKESVEAFRLSYARVDPNGNHMVSGVRVTLEDGDRSLRHFIREIRHRRNLEGWSRKCQFIKL